MNDVAGFQGMDQNADGDTAKAGQLFIQPRLVHLHPTLLDIWKRQAPDTHCSSREIGRGNSNGFTGNPRKHGRFFSLRVSHGLYCRLVAACLDSLLLK